MKIEQISKILSTNWFDPEEHQLIEVNEVCDEITQSFRAFIGEPAGVKFNHSLWDASSNIFIARFSKFTLTLFLKSEELCLKMELDEISFGFTEPMKVVIRDFVGDWSAAYSEFSSKVDELLYAQHKQSMITIDGEKLVRKTGDYVYKGALSYGGFGLVGVQKCFPKEEVVVNLAEANLLADKMDGEWVAELINKSSNRPFFEYADAKLVTPVIKKVVYDGIDAYQLDEGCGVKTYAIMDTLKMGDGEVKVTEITYLEKNIKLPCGVANTVHNYLERHLNK